MSSPAGTDLTHPAVSTIERAGEVLKDLVETPFWSLTAAETSTLVDQLEKVSRQVVGLQARALTHAETVEVAAAAGSTSTANWLAHTHVLTRAEAFRRTRLSSALDAHPATGEALTHGQLDTEQAGVICHALKAVERLDDDLAALAEQRSGLTQPELVASAEQHLLVQARKMDAKELRALGRKILDVVCPEVGEAHEQRLLENEEEQAAQDTKLTMSPDGHGRVHGRFTLPEAIGAMFKKQLLSFASPKHQAATAKHDPDTVLLRKPSARKMGAAFAEWIQRYPSDRLPAAGGVPATVVVTMGLAELLSGLGTATLDDGTKITASQARKMACEAGIIPIVLDGASQPLDVGRTKRFHTGPQRHAIALRDGGCTVESCDWPPGMCHVHHEIEWSRGGGTSVEKGRLLCPRHHAWIHNPAYKTTRLGTGKLRFTRRT